MKNPMSNIVFGRAAPTLYSFKQEHSGCYFECAGSKVIEISLKPSATAVDSLDITLA
jgi:hypothetical protein